MWEQLLPRVIPLQHTERRFPWLFPYRAFDMEAWEEASLQLLCQKVPNEFFWAVGITEGTLNISVHCIGLIHKT